MDILLLDIGNVIVSVDFGPFCRAVAGDREDAGGVVRSRYCDGSLKDRLDRGALAPDEFLRAMADDPATVDAPTTFFRDAWQGIFSPMPGSLDGIRALRERYRIWIMSDTDPLHYAHLVERYSPVREAERRFLSFEHGFLKREPAAFVHVVESSGIDPGRFTLLDDRQVNVDACRRAGMQGILFTSWDEPGGSATGIPTGGRA